MRLILSALVLILLPGINILVAQDIHFSQFTCSPLNLNPALTGNFDGDIRGVGNHRNQWSSITVPYRTFSASADARIDAFDIPKSFIGAGLLFNTDKAGDSDFGTTQIKLGAAFHRIMNADSSLSLSAGLNISYNQNNINYTALYFGNQYNGMRYDPDISSNEVFQENVLRYFDFSLGLGARWMINKKFPLDGGISFTHLNKPQQSFYNNALVELERKFNFHAGSVLPLGEKTSFLPQVVYYRQGRFNEFIFGGLFRKSTDNLAIRSVYIGGWFRAKDAGILKLGLDYQNLSLGISYDLNISRLAEASRGRGGFEISLIYIYTKPHPKYIPVKRQCPAFI